MALWTNIDEEAGKPKYLSSADKANTVGVSPFEATANNLTAGWNLKTTGTGGRAGRVFYETLVAMGSMTGDNDSITPEIVISLTNAYATKLVGQSHTISAFALVDPAQAATFTYQWQESADDGTTWATAPGTSNTSTYTTNCPTAGTFNYRVLVSSNVADTQISSSGIIIVVAP
jgi:hypothetical protein